MVNIDIGVSTLNINDSANSYFNLSIIKIISKSVTYINIERILIIFVFFGVCAKEVGVRQR